MLNACELTHSTEPPCPIGPPPPPPSSPYLRVSFPYPGVCHCAVTRPPVNALHQPIWDALHALLMHLRNHAFPIHTRALVLSSGLAPRAGCAIFSAGLDLGELRAAAGSSSASHFLSVWRSASSALAALYGSPLHTVAAVDGLAPAAGCALVLACDERIATLRTRIGLDEVRNGAPVPATWAALFIRAANSRPVAEAVLCEGSLLDARAARRLHLVSRLVGADEAGRSNGVALRAARKAAAVGPTRARARGETKGGMRAAFVKRWVDGFDMEARAAHAVVLAVREEARARL